MAVLLSGIVENIIEAAPGFTLPGRFILPAPDGVDIGFTYANGTFTDLRVPEVITPEEARAALPQITPRQLRLGLLSINITEADVGFKLVNDPAGMIEWKCATYFKRTHPLVDSLGALFSITPEQIDSLWAWAAGL
ncbi:hypothetical protein Lo5R7ANS_58 [Mesorhizobium phage vB_MloP_Lo5R7ANS]|uniref:Uncharacterized protein n=1 Tax=Mesorhizobium phage vB_MloP_Lo5R7ANS TaxID=1527771 RepID=A0A076YJ67_9CAUD|nr:hypothetical protein Lo5R7ANS_58 [Mesorhizobium phage vB_MloP_Lo5R7ANS]AIK68528.1 hypothetical protein Lo5R7ANS_58 [Mesorhizobium phage vB_MloP_Lo5R7ANS]